MSEQCQRRAILAQRLWLSMRALALLLALRAQQPPLLKRTQPPAPSRAVPRLVERFDIEPYSDFSAK